MLDGPLRAISVHSVVPAEDRGSEFIRRSDVASNCEGGVTEAAHVVRLRTENGERADWSWNRRRPPSTAAIGPAAPVSRHRPVGRSVSVCNGRHERPLRGAHGYAGRCSPRHRRRKRRAASSRQGGGTRGHRASRECRRDLRRASRQIPGPRGGAKAPRPHRFSQPMIAEPSPAHCPGAARPNSIASRGYDQGEEQDRRAVSRNVAEPR